MTFKRTKLFLILICIVALLTACTEQAVNGAYSVLNDNIPQFEKSELSVESFEYYSELDHLGRCGAAVACIGKDIMPTEERGKIGQIRPSGWQLTKYDMIDGKYLYNRCHLIGYQLTGENANERNLITGTRYMNVNGMLPFENKVAEYFKNTGNHVMYRVTPIFEGDNLLAKGVQMEAFSVEDKGKGIAFNVFIENVQPGVEINYLDGTSSLIAGNPSEEVKKFEVQNNAVKNEKDYGLTEGVSYEDADYILNNNTMKFHETYCSSVEDIKPKNKAPFKGERDEAISRGYSPCGICHP